MVSEVGKNEKWISLKDLSEMSGRSINAVRLLIHRGKIKDVRKLKGRGHGEWLIRRESLEEFMSDEISDNLNAQEISDEMTTLKSQEDSMPVIPLEYFDSRQREWMEERDKLQAGLMMYRYKFEESERRMKLLPAPAEVVGSRIEELERTIRDQAADLERARRPWWRKLFRSE